MSHIRISSFKLIFQVLEATGTISKLLLVTVNSSRPASLNQNRKSGTNKKFPVIFL